MPKIFVKFGVRWKHKSRILNVYRVRDLSNICHLFFSWGFDGIFIFGIFWGNFYFLGKAEGSYNWNWFEVFIQFGRGACACPKQNKMDTEISQKNSTDKKYLKCGI